MEGKALFSSTEGMQLVHNAETSLGLRVKVT